MTTTVARSANVSSLRSAKLAGIPNILGGTRHVTSEFLKTIFSENTSAMVARFLGLESKRTAEHRLLKTRGYTEDELAGIICSHYGARYIKALMDALPENQRPDWYRVHEPLMELADAQKLQLVARSKTAKAIRRTVDADDELTAAIRRAQSISVQDPEFSSGTLDALGAMARVFAGTMAQAKGRRK